MTDLAREAAVAASADRTDGVRPALRRLGNTGHLRDLTHVFRQGFPVGRYDSPCREDLASYEEEGFTSNRWSFVEHTGTHVDAPSHFSPDGVDVSRIPLDDLVVTIAVIDIAARVADDPDTAVTVADIERYERTYGRLPDGAGVFMRSGWDARADDSRSYNGVGDDDLRRSPGFGADAAGWLIDNRDVTCLGVDSPSIDTGSSTGFPVHHRWLGAGRYAVEGLAGLSAIPAAGAVAFIGVVPWENGTGGPCRVIATW
ncbi:cyclase family protein [Streptomyces sp. 900116325]